MLSERLKKTITTISMALILIGGGFGLQNQQIKAEELYSRAALDLGALSVKFNVRYRWVNNIYNNNGDFLYNRLFVKVDTAIQNNTELYNCVKEALNNWDIFHGSNALVSAMDVTTSNPSSATVTIRLDSTGEYAESGSDGVANLYYNDENVYGTLSIDPLLVKVNRGEIYLNKSDMDNFGTGDIAHKKRVSVIAHELGHILGMGHTMEETTDNSIMNTKYGWSSNNPVIAPTVKDVNDHYNMYQDFRANTIGFTGSIFPYPTNGNWINE